MLPQIGPPEYPRESPQARSYEVSTVAKESVHKKLERVRPPRVHVTYDVEVGNAIEVKELPFVMGVMADLSGQPREPLARMKDRRFVEITPDNFDGVLESFKPTSPMPLTINSARTPMLASSKSTWISRAWTISAPPKWPSR